MISDITPRWRRNVSDEEIENFKKKMRKDLRRDKEFDIIELGIRKVLCKMDGDPISSKACVPWKGDIKGSFILGDKTVQIRRILYHWIFEDLRLVTSSNIVNLESCETYICCNISHLIKRNKIGYKIGQNNISQHNNKRNREQDVSDIGKTLHQSIEYPNQSNEKRNRYIASRKQNAMLFYLQKNCGYRVRSSLSETERPTIDELYMFVSRVIGIFKPIVPDRPFGVNKDDCIHAKRNIRFRGKQISTIRVCYRWFIGDIPEKTHVFRKCKRSGHCIRPEHLQTLQYCENEVKSAECDEEEQDSDTVYSSTSEDSNMGYDNQRKKRKIGISAEKSNDVGIHNFEVRDSFIRESINNKLGVFFK